MNANVTTLAISLLGCSAAAAQAVQSPEKVCMAAGAKASPPRAAVAYGADPLQVTDLRLPDGPGPYPVAIIVHEGY